MAPYKNGAVDETRTRDLHLGKVALYQLSYYRTFCGNSGGASFECPAAEMVHLQGLEPWTP